MGEDENDDIPTSNAEDEVEFCLHRCNSLYKTGHNLQGTWKETSEKGDRNLVNELINFSEADNDLLETIVCNDWKEATVGWQHTIPFVKYAWKESKKANSSENIPEKRKLRNEKNQTKNKGLADDLYWRCTIEPVTYRYIPGGFHRHTKDPYFVQKLILKKTEHVQIQHHIERVREHFEKTLRTANNPHYSAKLRDEANKPKRSNSEGSLKVQITERPGSRGLRKKVEHLSKALSNEYVKGAEGDVLRHVLPKYEVHKVEINNPFSDPHLEETLAAHSPKFRFRHATENELSKLVDVSKNETNFQGFRGSLLNPLLKVTPQQRQVKDDSEALKMSRDAREITSLSLDNKKEEDSLWHTSNMPSLSGDCSDSYTVQMSGPSYGASVPHERLHQIKFDFYSGSSLSRGSSNSSADTNKEFSLAKELQSVNQLLNQKTRNPKIDVNKSKRSRVRPQNKLCMIAQGAGGDPKSILGESLHRGVIDRDRATAVASELLPGVNGQRVEMPLNSQRIL